MKQIFTLILLAIYLVSNGQNQQLEELGKLYMAGEFDQTIKKAKEYLSTDSENIDYKLFLGRALADQGDFKSSIPYLNYVAENDQENSWRKAWAEGYLGSGYYMLADYANSEASIKSCLDLNATRNATNYALKRNLLFGFDSFFKDWTIVESENFRFHFQNSTESEIQLFIRTREKSYEEIHDFFKSTLPKKIDFFIWNSKEDARRILHSELGFADPHYCIVHSYIQQTKGHEMTHVISNYLTGDIKKTGLINEGTAVYLDLSNQNREESVLNWITSSNGKIDLKDIWTNWARYPDELSYPLSGLFVKEIILKFGKEKFLDFFTDQTYEHAKTIFGKEFDEFIAEFEKKYNK